MDTLDIQAIKDAARYQIAPPKSVSALKSFASSMVLENVGLSAVALSPFIGETGESRYDPYEGLSDDDALQYAPIIYGARSKDERDYLISRAKREETLRANAQANPVSGFLGGLAGGILSPENLVPLGAVSKVYSAAKLTRNFSRAAAVSDSALTAMASTALAEAALMRMQDQRTGEQAAVAVLSSGLLVGALGGFAHSLGAAGERISNEVYSMTVKSFDSEVAERVAATGKEIHEFPANHLRKIVQESASKVFDRGDDVIARDVVEGMENPILKGFLRYGLRWAPNGKLITSSIEEARAAGRALIDIPYKMSSHDTVVPNADSASSIIKKRAAMYSLRSEVAARDTRKSVFEKAKSKGLDPKVTDLDPVTGGGEYWREGFYRDVKWAIANGGKYPKDIAEEFKYTKHNPMSDDIIKAVESTAKEISEFGEEHFEQLLRIGYAVDKDLKGTSKGHAFRMWNPDTLEQHKELWDEKVPELLVKKHGYDIQEATDLAQEWYRTISEGISRGELDISKFVGESTLVKGRQVFLEDEFLDGRSLRDADGNPVSFLENDIRVVLNAHMQKSAGHLEMARRFAPVVDDQWDDSIKFAMQRTDAELRPSEQHEIKTPEDRLARRDQALEIARSVDEIHVRRALAVENTPEAWARNKQYREDGDALRQIERQFKAEERKLARTEEEVRALSPEEQIADDVGKRIAKRERNFRRNQRKAYKAANEQFQKNLAKAEARYAESVQRIGDSTLERAVKLEAELARVKSEAPEYTGKGARRAEKATQKQKARIAALEKQINEEYASGVRAEGEAFGILRGEEWNYRRFMEAELERFRLKYEAESEAILRRGDEEISRIQRVSGEAAESVPRMKTRIGDLVREKNKIRARMAEVETSAKYYDEIYDGTQAIRTEVSPVGDVEATVAQMLDAGRSFNDIANFLDNRLVGIKKANAQDGVEGLSYRRWMWRAHSERLQHAIKNKASQREINKIKSERKSEDEAFRLIRDRITNRDRFAEDPESWIHRIDSGVRKMLFLTKMGGVALSQIPDLAGHIFVNGFTPTFEGFGILMRGLKDDLMDTIGDDISEVIWSAEVAGPLQRNLLLSAITETHQKRTKIEGAMDSMVDYMSTLSLVKYVNGAQKVLASVSGSNRIIKQSMRIYAGQQLPQEEMDALASVGIDADMARRIARMAAVFGKREKGGHWLPKTNTWKGDYDAKSAFEAAVNQLVNRAIVTPDAGSMPGLMSYPILRTMLSFRNFAMTSFQKHFVPALQRHDADTLATLAASTGLGAIAYSLKEMFAGRELSDDPKEYILQGMMQGGLFAIPSEFNSILENLSGGRFGVGPAVLDKPMVPSRPGAEAIMGAGWGWFEDVYDTAGTLVRQFDPSAPGLGLSEGTVGKVRDTFVPMHSIFYIRRGLDVIEDWTNSFLGVEAKK